jgi:hypothetical protein
LARTLRDQHDDVTAEGSGFVLEIVAGTRLEILVRREGLSADSQSDKGAIAPLANR